MYDNIDVDLHKAKAKRNDYGCNILTKDGLIRAHDCHELANSASWARASSSLMRIQISCI